MRRFVLFIMMLCCNLCLLLAQVNIVQHKVKRGETLESISRKYGITVEQIRSANPNLNTLIYVGLDLNIPIVKANDSNKINKEKAGNSKNNTKGFDAVDVTSRKSEVGKDSDRKGEKKILNSPSFADIYDSFKANWNIDVIAGIKGGYINFSWEDGNPKSGFGGGLNVGTRIIKEKETSSFIPKGYFAKFALGYSRKGSGAFPIDYLSFEILPIGYRYSLESGHTLFGNLGLFAGLPFSDVKTDKKSFKSKTDVGVSLGVGIEYFPFGLSVSYEHSFTKACDSNLNLYNRAVFLSLTYNLFSF